MIQISCMFDGGPFDGRTATIGIPDGARTIPSKGGQYRLVEGPVLKAVMAGADTKYLCLRAHFEPDEPELTDEQISRELAEAGIDMTPAFKRLHAMIDDAKAKQPSSQQN